MSRILFLHPDLGIGGAERLIVDSAVALKNRGHNVSILTNYHDPNHCFEETRNGTIPVMVVGDWIPRSVFGRLLALCAYIRIIFAAIYVSLYLSRIENIDLIFCDQISVGIPILKLSKCKPKILFYCHFPDQLLSKPEGLLKKIYRMPLNYIEEVTTGQSDQVLVNSKFSGRVFKETFKSLDIVPNVLYPSLNTDNFDAATSTYHDEICSNIPVQNFVMLSLNRYERKKNVLLALQILKALEEKVSKDEWNKLQLVIAGGYDTNNMENIEYFQELNTASDAMNVSEKVKFLKSPSDSEKLELLKRCNCLIYTPENEHFGIVPLEGMYTSKVVIAVNSGGPTETIVNESTGFLCEPNAEEFAISVLKILRDTARSDSMGAMGRKRVEQHFSYEAFTEKLDSIVRNLIEKKRL